MPLTLRALEHLDPADEARYGVAACWLARLLVAGARVPEGFVIPALTRPPARWDSEERAAFLAFVKGIPGKGPLMLRPSVPPHGPDGSPEAQVPQPELAVPRQGVLDRVGAVVSAWEPATAGGQDEARCPWAIIVQRQPSFSASGRCRLVESAARGPVVSIEVLAAGGRSGPEPGPAEPMERWRIYRSGQGRWEPRLVDLGGTPSPQQVYGQVASRYLSLERALEIADLMALMAEKLGMSVDMEWQVDADQWIYWLQGGPCLQVDHQEPMQVEQAFSAVDDGPVVLWSLLDLPALARPPSTGLLSPLGWSLWQRRLLPAWRALVAEVPAGSALETHLALWDRVQGHICWNLNAVLSLPFGRWLLRRRLARHQASLLGPVGALLKQHIVVRRRIPGGPARVVLPFLWAQVRNLGRALGAFWPGRLLAQVRRQRQGLRVAAPRGLCFLSAGDLLATLRAAAEPSLPLASLFFAVWFKNRLVRRPGVAASSTFLAGTDSASEPFLALVTDFEALVRAARPLHEAFQARDGVENDEPWAETCRQALESSHLGRAWLNALQRFLESHGHRGAAELDVSAPRWGDDPAVLLREVARHLGAPQQERLVFRLKRFAAQQGGRGRHGGWPVREWARLQLLLADTLALAFRGARQAALELGNRLVSRGFLEAADDIFWLSDTELAAIVHGTAETGEPSPVEVLARVRSRRGAAAEAASRPLPPVFRSDGVPLFDNAAAPPPRPVRGSVEGEPLGTGVGRGLARLATRADPLALDGAVLVLPELAPHWFLVLPRLAGVVVGAPAASSVAAVVVQQMRIPAVFGVGDELRHILEGATVEVDGLAGRVKFGPGPGKGAGV